MKKRGAEGLLRGLRLYNIELKNGDIGKSGWIFLKIKAGGAMSGCFWGWRAGDFAQYNVFLKIIVDI